MKFQPTCIHYLIILLNENKKTPLNLHKICNNTSEAEDHKTDEDGVCAPFSRQFKCLESIINCTLDNTTDTQVRTKASRMAIGVMSFMEH